VSVGAELGVAGSGVSSSGLPYYLYANGGVAHLISLKAELLGGGHRPALKLLGAEYAVLPIPLVTLTFEPSVAFVNNSIGPSLGLRATGTLPATKLQGTGYVRVEYLDSRATTEIGLGVDYPVAPLVRIAASAIQFNGGFEPTGTLFTLGLKFRLGV
jgi:hypothetical protein